MNLKVRMVFYAIKHLPSGGFLPVRIKGRGNSFTEPTTQEPPRMFTDRRSARCALSAWLKGEWVRNTSEHWETGDVDTWYDPVKVESRKSDEMEVVEIEIVELL